MMNTSAKYEVSSLNHPKDIEGFPKSLYLLSKFACACAVSRDT